MMSAAPEIPISLSELHELQRCYQCDCATYPICTWIGAPCTECFDVDQFTHFDVDVVNPGLFVPSGSASNPRALTHTMIEEVRTQPNGDCLYECIARALNHYLSARAATGEITVKSLRAFVARSQTPETFEAYQVLARHQPEYTAISKIRTLRALKNVMQQTGAEVGPDHCVWGDENAISIISRAFRLRVAVFDEKGKLVQTIGTPDLKHTILLRHNRSRVGQEHFTLLRFNDQTVLQQHEWTWIQRRI